MRLLPVTSFRLIDRVPLADQQFVELLLFLDTTIDALFIGSTTDGGGLFDQRPKVFADLGNAGLELCACKVFGHRMLPFRGCD
jgi:hypothetical protein